MTLGARLAEKVERLIVVSCFTRHIVIDHQFVLLEREIPAIGAIGTRFADTLACI